MKKILCIIIALVNTMCLFVGFSSAAEKSYITWDTVSEVTFSQEEKDNGVFGFPASYESKITYSFPAEGGFKMKNPSGTQEAMTVNMPSFDIEDETETYSAGLVWNAHRAEGDTFSLFIYSAEGAFLGAIRANAGKIGFGNGTSYSNIYLYVDFDQTKDVEASLVFDPVNKTATPTINGAAVGNVMYNGSEFAGSVPYSGGIPGKCSISVWLNWCTGSLAADFLHLKSAFIRRGFDATKDCNYQTITSEKKNKITQDVNLMTSLESGAAVIWESSDPSVIDTLGRVTRGTNDKRVTLTAHIDYEGQILDKSFDFIVTAENKEENNFILSEEDFEEGADYYININDGGNVSVNDGELVLNRKNPGELSATKYFVSNMQEKPYNIQGNKVILEQYVKLSGLLLDNAMIDVFNKNGDIITSYGFEQNGPDVAFVCKSKDHVSSIDYQANKWAYVRLEIDSTNDNMKIFADNEEVDPSFEKKTLTSAGISGYKAYSNGEEGKFYLDNVVLMIEGTDKEAIKTDLDLGNISVSDMTTQDARFITDNLAFTQSGRFGSEFTYQSDNNNVLNSMGLVTRQKNDVTVTLTVKGKNGSIEKSKDIVLIVKGVDKTNLSIGKRVVSSGYTLKNYPEYAIDGVDETSWITDDDKKYITVNLLEKTKFNKLVIRQEPIETVGNAIKSFKVELSDNNRSWTTLYDGEFISECTEILTDEKFSKFVRVSITDCRGTTAGIKEIGIYYVPESETAILLDANEARLPDAYILKNDLEFMTTCGYGSTVVWTSSHPEIISNDGKLLSTPDYDTVVTITAVLKNDNQTYTMEFKRMVRGKKEQGAPSVGGGGGGRGVKSVTSGGIPVITNKEQYTSVDDGKEDNTPMFADVDANRWSYKFIKELKEANIVSGDGKFFNPEANVTREEFVKMIVSLLDFKEGGTNNFTDVVEGAWYEKYVSAAVNNGIITGISQNEFGVGRSITRQDMAVIALRAIEKSGKKLNAKSDVNFNDEHLISSYAKDAVKILADAGIINGYNGEFKPGDYLSREQAASILCLIRKEILQ